MVADRARVPLSTMRRAMSGLHSRNSLPENDLRSGLDPGAVLDGEAGAVYTRSMQAGTLGRLDRRITVPGPHGARDLVIRRSPAEDKENVVRRLLAF